MAEEISPKELAKVRISQTPIFRVIFLEGFISIKQYFGQSNLLFNDLPLLPLSPPLFLCHKNASSENYARHRPCWHCTVYKGGDIN